MARFLRSRQVSLYLSQALGARGNKKTYVADGDVLRAALLQDLGQHTLLLELKVHLGLVGLDLNQHITGGESITGLLLPRANVASGHGGRQGGHLDDGVRWV